MGFCEVPMQGGRTGLDFKGGPPRCRYVYGKWGGGLRHSGWDNPRMNSNMGSLEVETSQDEPWVYPSVNLGSACPMGSTQETLAASIPFQGPRPWDTQKCQARVPNLKMATVVQFNKFKGSNDFSSSLRPLPQGEELQLRALIWVLYQLYSWGCKCPAQEHSRAL